MEANGQLLNTFTPTPTIAGGGLALDSNGNTVVSDWINKQVIKFNSNGAVTSVFTTNNPALNGPAGMTIDSTGNVWCADYTNQHIVVWDGVNGTLLCTYNTSLVVGGFSPSGIAFDPSGSGNMVVTASWSTVLT